MAPKFQMVRLSNSNKRGLNTPHSHILLEYSHLFANVVVYNTDQGKVSQIGMGVPWLRSMRKADVIVGEPVIRLPCNVPSTAFDFDVILMFARG